MATERLARRKVVEWLQRYLPCEIASTVAELGAATLIYLWTGSFALAAIVGTVASSVGYYGTAYLNAVRWSYQHRTDRSRLARAVMANALALRSIAVEFGPAEAIDSLVVRPAALYLGQVLTGSPVVGLLIGKVVADIAFYGCAICSYERFKGLLAVSRPRLKEVGGEPVPTIATA
jgi:hypothetical protein